MNLEICLLHEGCTRALDPLIAAARARYAAERLEFHWLFGRTTVTQMQRVLNARSGEQRESPERKWLVSRLLVAQRVDPHDLWVLLLVQAFEGALVRRRREVSGEEDAMADGFVMAVFVGALEYLPAGRAKPRAVGSVGFGAAEGSAPRNQARVGGTG